MTDPKEFIYEFFPLQADWQLLKQPITLQEFEELPFVRSLFFRYGLYFSDPNTKAVMYTDSTGTITNNYLLIKKYDRGIFYSMYTLYEQIRKLIILMNYILASFIVFRVLLIFHKNMKYLYELYYKYIFM